MTQPGFFDLDNRHEKLNHLGDPLVQLNEFIDWKSFLPILSKTREKERKSPAGRKPFDLLLMLKILVIQHLFNLSDEQTEFQINDRYSFARFLGLQLEDTVPDYTTIWNFRDALVELSLVDELFKHFDWQLEKAGFIARKGQILDATIVEVPIQRNSRSENKQIKAGEVPEDWQDEPAKLSHKDTDARWAKKNNKSYYGYKNHINIDVDCKIIRSYEVTDAASSDHNQFEKLLDPSNTGRDIYADGAYRSEKNEGIVKKKGMKSKIHYKGQRNHPLSEHKKGVNHNRSKIRARVEHVFGSMENEQGGKYIQTIGLARAKVKIGLMNLVYNMKRFAFLCRSRRVAPSMA